MIRPLALALEACGDRIVALGFFTKSGFCEFGVSGHEVAGNERHFHTGFPFRIELLAGALFVGGIPVFAFFAIGFNPFHRLGEFGFVIDLAVYAANEFGHVDRFDAHAQPMLEEGGINN